MLSALTMYAQMLRYSKGGMSSNGLRSSHPGSLREERQSKVQLNTILRCLDILLSIPRERSRLDACMRGAILAEMQVLLEEKLVM